MFVFSFELILFLSGFVIQLFPLLFVILIQEVLHGVATMFLFFLHTFDALLVSL